MFVRLTISTLLALLGVFFIRAAIIMDVSEQPISAGARFTHIVERQNYQRGQLVGTNQDYYAEVQLPSGKTAMAIIVGDLPINLSPGEYLKVYFFASKVGNQATLIVETTPPSLKSSRLNFAIVGFLLFIPFLIVWYMIVRENRASYE